MRPNLDPVHSALAVVALSGVPARADLTGFDSYGNLQYSQTTNNTQPMGTPLAFYASRLFYDTAGDITSGTGTSGGNALIYTPQAGNFALAQTDYITPDQLNSYLTPNSNLAFNITGGNLAGLSGSSPAYGPTLFPSAVPYLTGDSYNQLQGLNVAQDATITFNGYTPVAGANESDIFITITNATTGAVAFSAIFTDPSTMSAFLAANTLDAGTTYNLEVDYSSRLNSTGTFDGNDTPFTAGYDVRTEISFTTAVPEPSSLILTSLGVVSGVLVARRRRIRPSA